MTDGPAGTGFNAITIVAGIAGVATATVLIGIVGAATCY